MMIKIIIVDFVVPADHGVKIKSKWKNIQILGPC